MISGYHAGVLAGAVFATGFIGLLLMLPFIDSMSDRVFNRILNSLTIIIGISGLIVINVMIYEMLWLA